MTYPVFAAPTGDPSKNANIEVFAAPTTNDDSSVAVMLLDNSISFVLGSTEDYFDLFDEVYNPLSK